MTSQGRWESEWLDSLNALQWGDLATDVQKATNSLLLDALGVAAGGVAASGVDKVLLAIRESSGCGPMRIPWTALTVPPLAGAMALSCLIHAWDFDDTHDGAVVHTATVAVPAAMAGAIAKGTSGADLLAGVVVGVQLLTRLSLAIGPQPGMVRTAALGAIAAAGAAARAMRLPGARFASALRLALPLCAAPVSRQAVADGAVSKRVQPAQAVHAGVGAAFLAAHGLDGAKGWLTGPYGLLRLGQHTDGAVDVLTASGWEVSHLSLKPYPVCRYAHAAIAATLAARIADASAAEVHVPRGEGFALVSRPFQRRGHPVVDAQFSIPWLVAAALRTGAIDLTTLVEPTISSPDIELLASRITVIRDLDEMADGMAPAQVTVFAGSQREQAEVTTVPGTPRAPLSSAQLIAKAGACTAFRGLAPTAVDRLVDVVKRLPDVPTGECGRALSTLSDEDFPDGLPAQS